MGGDVGELLEFLVGSRKFCLLSFQRLFCKYPLSDVGERNEDLGPCIFESGSDRQPHAHMDLLPVHVVG